VGYDLIISGPCALVLSSMSLQTAFALGAVVELLFLLRCLSIFAI
jgi:hypothetical protein